MDLVDLCQSEDSRSPNNYQPSSYDFVGEVINSGIDHICDNQSGESYSKVTEERGIIPPRSEDEDGFGQRERSRELPGVGYSGALGRGRGTGRAAAALHPSVRKRKAPEGKSSKSLKPGECMKYMVVEVFRELLEWEEFSLAEGALRAAGVGLRGSHRRALVSWRRGVSEDRSHALLVLPIAELLLLLETESLLDRVASIKREHVYENFTLLLYGAASHFRIVKNKNNARWKNGVKQQPECVSPQVTENDLDYYLTKLLFSESVSCTRAETPADLAQVLLQFTKAVAEAPFKKEKYAQDLQADFYMRGDNKDCVRVDAQGNGLLRLWSQSLGKLPLAGPDTAAALVRAFPAPVRMLAAPPSPRALAALPVRRDAAPLSAPRCLGPELARRLRSYFTATEGDIALS